MIRSSDYFTAWHAVQSGALPLVDLRSPGEYARGAMPKARNVPLFDDGERHRVGLTYKTEGSHEAVALGLEILAAKAEGFAAALADAAGPRRALAVHCWRGGMRSGAVARWLSVMGFDVTILAGGYKAYRRDVLALLDDFARHPLLVLNGRTGAGKTDLLRAVAGSVPTIDLEGIACHRGSAFGDFHLPAPSPTPQDFENLLANAYFPLRAAPEILVEVESDLGPLRMPPGLRKRIMASPMVFLERDEDDRVARLVAEYAPAWGPADEALFQDRMGLLKRHLKPETSEAILAAVTAGDLPTAVRLLLRWRYDVTYDKALRRQAGQAVAHFNLTRGEGEAMAFLRSRLGPVPPREA